MCVCVCLWLQFIELLCIYGIIFYQMLLPGTGGGLLNTNQLLLSWNIKGNHLLVFHFVYVYLHQLLSPTLQILITFVSQVSNHSLNSTRLQTFLELPLSALQSTNYPQVARCEIIGLTHFYSIYHGSEPCTTCCPVSQNHCLIYFVQFLVV